MKLIIDIPEEIYKASKIIDVQYEDVVQIPFEVIANGTPIPDNSTNRDVISREAVRKILTKYHLGESMIAEELNELPSVTQKSGHWMEKKHNGNMIMYHRYKCSVCDEKAKGKTGIWVQLFDYKYNYCPNCGAKMESEE